MENRIAILNEYITFWRLHENPINTNECQEVCREVGAHRYDVKRISGKTVCALAVLAASDMVTGQSRSIFLTECTELPCTLQTYSAQYASCHRGVRFHWCSGSLWARPYLGMLPVAPDAFPCNFAVFPHLFSGAPSLGNNSVLDLFMLFRTRMLPNHVRRHTASLLRPGVYRISPHFRRNREASSAISRQQVFRRSNVGQTTLGPLTPDT